MRADWSRARIDDELREVDGIATWTEFVHGGECLIHYHGRHLAAVLRARPAFLAAQPRLRPPTLPGLRLVTPRKVARSA